MVYRNFSSDLRHLVSDVLKVIEIKINIDAYDPPLCTCLLLARLQGQSMNCCRVHPDQSDPSQQEGSSSGVGVRPSHMCREVFHVAPRCTCLHSLRQRDTGSLSRVMQQNFLFGDKDGAKGRREKKQRLPQLYRTFGVCTVKVLSEFYSPLYTHQVCQQER